jgi:predicted RNase H-like HicB family nuclease
LQKLWLLPEAGCVGSSCEIIRLRDHCLMKLTAAYKKVGDWWAAWVEEIPGVNTQGETLEEARENLKDALRMVLEANRELSEKEQEATRREDLVVA